MAPRAAARLTSLGRKDVFLYDAGKLDWIAAGLPTEGTVASEPNAGTVARSHPPLARLDERVGDVRRRVTAAGWDTAVVVDAQGVVLGLAREQELEKDATLFMEAAMRPGPSTFRPYVPIREMADYMTEHQVETSPITTSDGKLVGLLYRDDAVREAEGCADCVRKLI